MPIFEYLCNACGNRFDEIVRKPEDDPSFCKYCSSPDIERQVTAHGGIHGAFGTVPKNNAGSYKRGKP